MTDPLPVPEGPLVQGGQEGQEGPQGLSRPWLQQRQPCLAAPVVQEVQEGPQAQEGQPDPLCRRYPYL